MSMMSTKYRRMTAEHEHRTRHDGIRAVLWVAAVLALAWLAARVAWALAVGS